MSAFGGVVTGVGSWPGTDPLEAATVVLGELGALPHLAELPERGMGADMIGRTAGMLVGIPLDVSTTGYRIDGTDGTAARRAHDYLGHDLDALEEAWERGGYAGTNVTVKVQATGPLSLAAALELRGGHRVLTDKGALRDVTESLCEGLRLHVADVARRLGTQVVVQLDEPAIAAVLAGSLRGTSMLHTVPALPEPNALALLDTVIAACGRPVLIHCCADDVPFGLLGRTGADAVGFDLAKISGSKALDGLGVMVDQGKALVVGAVPTRQPEQPAKAEAYAARTSALFNRLGFGAEVLATQMSVSPACGLAGAGASWARQALRLSGQVRRMVAELDKVDPNAEDLADRSARR